MATSIVVAFIIVIAFLIVFSLFFRFVPLGLWISARASGVRVSIGSLVVVLSRIFRKMVSRLVAGS